jgi:hypothetical protein
MKIINYPYGPSVNLLDNKKLSNNAEVKLPAWGVIVAEE